MPALEHAWAQTPLLRLHVPFPMSTRLLAPHVRQAVEAPSTKCGLTLARPSCGSRSVS
jgi:hypothetical protein